MKRLFVIMLALSYWTVQGQTMAHYYQKAAEYPNLIKDKVFYSPQNITWNEDLFWYVQQTPNGKEYLRVDTKQKSKRTLFDHQFLAHMLSKATGQKVKADSLPLSNLQIIKNPDFISFEAFGKKWEYTNDTGHLTDKGQIPSRGPQSYWNNRYDDSQGAPVYSPDSQYVALIRNNNVYVHPNGQPQQLQQLSFDGAPGEYYSAFLVWSPDAKKLAATKVRKVENRTLYFIESSPATQLQPILHTRNYPKPGDALPQHQPVLFNIETGKSYSVPYDLVLNQYSLSRPKWTKDSKAFTFEYNQRGHQKYQVFELHAETGLTRALITEESPTFIDYSGKKYRYDLENEIIWASERDGWNHLYLYDRASGQVKNQITKGEWVVRRVVHVNEKERYIIFEGSGKDTDPYLIHYYKVNLDGSGLVDLTPESANHKAFFNKDHSLLVDTYSRIDLPQITVLRETATGKVIMELEKADIQN